MRRALLVVAVAAVASVALAQGGAVAPGAKAVVQAGRTWSESEILSMFSAPVRKQLSWGRVVRFGGAAVVAASLIYSALDWFYLEAQRSANPELDRWFWGDAGVSCLPVTDFPSPMPTKSQVRHFLTVPAACTETDFRPHLWGSYNYGLGKYVWALGVMRMSAQQWVPGYWQELVPQDSEPSGKLEHYKFGSIEQLVIAHWMEYLYDRRQAGGLQEHLSDIPASVRSLAQSVVPGAVEAWSSSGSFPYTYEEPFGAGGGFTLEPAPNINQWWDNPTADPNIDTDGDGWPDWEEWVSKTDPNNPDSKPTVTTDPSKDSDGDGWTDQEEVRRGTDPHDADDFPAGTPDPIPEPLPDSDGDGVPDAYDPCPFDRLNACADGGGEEEFPDDYAREGTLQGVASDTGSIRSSSERTAAAAEGILDALAGEGEVSGEVTFPELAEAWAGVLAQLEASLESVRVAAEGKVLFQGVIPQLAVSGGGSCDEISITLLGINRQLGWCDSVFYTLLTTWARNGLALLMLIGFAFASARTVGAL